jgi:tagatose-6-phosphate ketose/aldose isomerase
MGHGKCQDERNSKCLLQSSFPLFRVIFASYYFPFGVPLSLVAYEQDHVSAPARDWPEVTKLLKLSGEAAGHLHTLHEILQQPATWRATADQMVESHFSWKGLLEQLSCIVLTGSGSSEYVGNCVSAAFQRRLGVTVEAIGSGALLTDATHLLPVERPALMISFARSGDSPESAGALSEVSHAEPEIRQLALTCNAEGKLARRAVEEKDIHAIVLNEKTNDRSLVMTSSFTNMVLAALSLAWSDDLDGYKIMSEALVAGGTSVLRQAFSQLQPVAELNFHRAFYLASPSTFGAAREAALKMTEMTAGRVMSVAETYLGLRHGPMSAVDAKTLIVSFLSSDAKVRAYECDLLQELTEKDLGMRKILVGSDIPSTLLQADDVAISHPAFAMVGDESAAILHVVVGQVLALFRCMHEGLRPDAPSESGVIHRVVQKFRLHGEAARSA